jgi:arabinan endo-1,5-alpha-L-arabinosidase
MMKHLSLLAFACALLLVSAGAHADKRGEKPVYRNPIVAKSIPDPTVMKDKDGYFYMYGTEDIHNMPIYRSRNLVDWTFVGTAFREDARPRTVKPHGDGMMWAPDINYINGKYVLYYTIGIWGREWESGIGVATAEHPEGPFTDHGQLIDSRKIGVQNSIDQFFIRDKGKNYLVWGSFSGIYIIQLTDDGLSIMPGAQKQQISGRQSEASYIYKHKGYYYYFGSAGSCCEGADSRYHVIYGRSKSLFGPYVTKSGERLLDGKYDTLIHGNEFVAGPGHNAEFVEDDKKNTWIIYHGYVRKEAAKGRQVFMSQVKWKDGWPYVDGDAPCEEATAPFFKKK